MISRDFEGKHASSFNYIASKYEFRFNTVTGCFEYKPLTKNGKSNKKIEWMNYDDRVKSDISLELLEMDYALTADKFNIFIESSTVSPDYNPFEEYFDNIDKWDGKTDYIKQLAETIKTDDDPVFYDILKKFLVGTVACLLDEDEVNDVCLVFQAGQGIGKSRWMRRLLPEFARKQYLCESAIDTRNKDHNLYLSQYWFIHLDELEALRSNDVSPLKSYITRQRISERKAYGRYKAHFVRRASFMGSVNDDKFLSDTTGNRRWLVFQTFKIDYLHKVDIDKLWAQCYSYYSEQFQHWFEPSEIMQINNRNERFREQSLEEQLLIENFNFPDEHEHGELMSTSEIMVTISKNSPQLANKLNAMRMGKALAKHCLVKKTKRGVSNYHCHYIGVEQELPFTPPSISESSKIPTDGSDDDLPF